MDMQCEKRKKYKSGRKKIKLVAKPLSFNCGENI